MKTKKKLQHYIFNLDVILGKGSFGCVYKGKDKDKQDQLIAVKQLDRTKVDLDQYSKQALMKQIKIMKRLQGQHIVRLLEVFQTSNNYYLVQEYCQGGTLRQILKNRTFTQQQGIQLLFQLLCGIIQLIKFGIIHRDLKPQNILISKNKLKIADFGLSKVVTSNSKMKHTIVGTPLYMSLQILKGQEYSQKADVWALGLIFYEILVGSLPFVAKFQDNLINLIENKQITYPDNLSNDCVDLLKGCLQVKQKNRFGWQQVLKHKLLKGRFQNFNFLQTRAKYLINKIRQSIHSQNLDLQKIYAKMGLDAKEELTFSKFQNLLFIFDQNIKQEQIKYLFDKFDENCNNLVQFNQITKWLQQNQVQSSKTLQLINYQEQGTVNLNQTDKLKKCFQVIGKLKHKLDDLKMDLEMVFSTFQKKNKDSLDFTEFKKLMSKIDKTLTNDQYKHAFKLFDINHDGYISFEEFTNMMCKITGDPVNGFKILKN